MRKGKREKKGNKTHGQNGGRDEKEKGYKRKEKQNEKREKKSQKGKKSHTGWRVKK